MYSPTSEAHRFIMDALRRLVRALREGSRASEKAVGLSSAQVFVLEQLRGGESLSINELAARTLTHQSSVSVVVSRLREARLVQTAPAPSDARKVEVTLTATGKAALGLSPGAAQATLIAGLRRMSPRDRESLRAGLAAWMEATGIAEDEPPMFFEEATRAAAPSVKRKGPRHV